MSAFARVAALLLTAFVMGAVPAQGQTAASAPADCTTVGASDAAALLGSDVEGPDALSQRGGICSFTSRSAAQDGVVSYAIVNPDRLAARRPYFHLLRIRCGNVRAPAPNARICATYAALAKAETIDDYYAARTAGADAVDGFGDAAASNGGALYVRRSNAVIEVTVRRDGSLDLEAAERLARLLIERNAT